MFFEQKNGCVDNSTAINASEEALLAQQATTMPAHCKALTKYENYL